MNKPVWAAGMAVLLLAGCATSTSYINYTNQQFPAKDRSYAVNVYSKSHPLGLAKPYYVIGEISVEGFASNGVNPGGLTGQAQDIARKRGADAIIDAETKIFHYYGDNLLRFTGELIVFSPQPANAPSPK